MRGAIRWCLIIPGGYLRSAHSERASDRIQQSSCSSLPIEGLKKKAWERQREAREIFLFVYVRMLLKKNNMRMKWMKNKEKEWEKQTKEVTSARQSYCYYNIHLSFLIVIKYCWFLAEINWGSCTDITVTIRCMILLFFSCFSRHTKGSMERWRLRATK